MVSSKFAEARDPRIPSVAHKFNPRLRVVKVEDERTSFDNKLSAPEAIRREGF